MAPKSRTTSRSRTTAAAPRGRARTATAAANTRAPNGTKSLISGFMEILATYPPQNQKALRRAALAGIRTAPLGDGEPTGRSAGRTPSRRATAATGGNKRMAGAATKKTARTATATAGRKRAASAGGKATARTKANTGTRKGMGTRAKAGQGGARTATASSGGKGAARSRRSRTGQSGQAGGSGGAMMHAAEPMTMGTAMHSEGNGQHDD